MNWWRVKEAKTFFFLHYAMINDDDDGAMEVQLSWTKLDRPHCRTYPGVYQVQKLQHLWQSSNQSNAFKDAHEARQCGLNLLIRPIIVPTLDTGWPGLVNSTWRWQDWNPRHSNQHSKKLTTMPQGLAHIKPNNFQPAFQSADHYATRAGSKQWNTQQLIQGLGTHAQWSGRGLTD